MLTDDEGNFEFRDITENSALSANKPGYFPENAGTTTVWSSPGTKGPLELRLVPEAVISGRVTDESGAPLPGVAILLRIVAVSNGLRHWEQRGGATTNAEGEFRIAELQAGEYSLQTSLKLDGPREGEAAAGQMRPPTTQ
jgi:protocatechuate 3,4-dioxygenase beta subunit